MTKRLLGIIIFSVLTVVIWIGFEVWMRLGSQEIQLNYENYLQTVDSEFDSETIDELVTREEEYMLIDRDDLD